MERKIYIAPKGRKGLRKKQKIVIGRKDVVDFPELNLWSIPAKIDTGADTSAIHVRKIRLETENEKAVLTCYFGPRKKKVFKDFTQTLVKSSNGMSQIRYVVQIKLTIFGSEFETYFTLTDRGSMAFPVLLGKKFLKKRFIVDVALSNLSQKNKLITL